MLMQTLIGVLIPFAGTTLGSACVFFMKKALHPGVQRALTGFAAGVMVAASFWSLLSPALEQSAALGRLSFLPAFIGFWLGVGFLLALDMDIDLIFKIAAIGIIVSILNQVLSRSGREEQATMTTLAGLVVVLMMVAQKIAELFDLVKTLFEF